MKKKFALGLLAVLLLLGFTIGLKAQQDRWFFGGPPADAVTLDRWDPHFCAHYVVSGPDMAADCALEPTGENYIGVRYKALLAEDELSETGWVILFGGNGFTVHGEYQPHFMDLMIIGSGASLYDDPLCDRGFPPFRDIWDNFSIQFGLSDYEDSFYGWIHENDIAAWTQDPQLFPRMYTNIDSVDPQAPDKIMATYQVDKGGTLEGKEIEVSFVREEVTSLPQDMNYFMDPDLEEGGLFCRPNSQDDILYRHWVATLKVPSLGINSSVDFYINASQGDKINGANTLNFIWENPGRPAIESDKFKVIIFDPEVKTTSGEWEKATRFLVDLRTPQNELPLNDKGELVGGFRKVNYKGRPAIEASFGYGYTDYVIDGNPNDYELSNATKGVIDLRYPANEPPIASFTYSPKHPVVNQTISFNASPSYDPDGNITCYEWDFGDGTNGTGKIVNHSYSSADTYKIALTVTDNDGATNSSSQYITIREANQIYLPFVMKNYSSGPQPLPPIKRVLFDEAHSEWVSIEGNYTEFADNLRSNGYTVERITTGPITYNTLKNYDVYVIGTAWGSFSQSEIDAIIQFVHEGGGLFLTGVGWSWVGYRGHIDTFPMNIIAANFGIKFLDDWIEDPTNFYPGGDVSNPLFHQMVAHPITRGVSIIGASDWVPCPLQALTTGPQAIVSGDDDAYSIRGNYPPGSYPPLVMGASHGIGRVVAIGHEGYFVNTSVHSYDNMQLGLNAIDWLAKKIGLPSQM